MPEKTARQALDSSSKRLQAEVDEDFVVDHLEVEKVTWKGDLPHRPYAPVFRSGPSLLTRGQQRWKNGMSGADLAQSVGIVAADAAMQSVPFRVEHAHYVSGVAWCGDDVVAVVGQRASMLTSVGVIEREDGSWSFREVWSGAPERARATGAPLSGITGAPGLFAFVTVASGEAKGSTIHIWGIRDGEWTELERIELRGRADELTFASPERLVYGMYPYTYELVRGKSGWEKRKIEAPYPYVAVDQGRVLALDDKRLSLCVFENGSQVQRLPLGKNDGARFAAHDGRVVAHVRARVAGRNAGPARLVGWRRDGDRYVQWLECEDPYAPPTGRAYLGLAGDTVFAAEPGGALHRLVFPS